MLTSPRKLPLQFQENSQATAGTGGYLAYPLLVLRISYVELSATMSEHSIQLKAQLMCPEHHFTFDP